MTSSFTSPSLSNLNKKNSGSKPILSVENPIDFIFFTILFKLERGSAVEGNPSGVYTSQINLATFPYLDSSQLNISQVSKSGFKYISASLILTKPSIEEPSNITWFFNAFSNCPTGISTLLIVPIMSVNIKRIYLTFSALAFSRIASFVYFFID